MSVTLTFLPQTPTSDISQVIPLKALNSATPIESYTGIWTEIKNLEMIEKQNAARAARIQINRELRCSICPNRQKYNKWSSAKSNPIEYLGDNQQS